MTLPNPFLQEITAWISAFPLQGQRVPTASPHPVWQLGNIPLLLHAVALPRHIKEELPLNFFYDLSEEMTAQGFQIIHLWEDAWQSNRALVISRIESLLGKNKSVYARLTTVSRLSNAQLSDFFQENHGNYVTKSRYRYGLWHKETLVAAASFTGAKLLRNEEKSWKSAELLRFATHQNTTVVGGLSKLISAFRAEVLPADLMTYADRDWSVGKSYERLGFVHEGNTPPHVFWVHLPSMQRFSAKQLALQEPDFQENEDILRAKNYVRISNAGSMKFRLTF